MPSPEPHQQSGAQFLAQRMHAALCDDRGLGKTVTAILAADLVNAKTILVSCPASVRSSWEEHFRLWRRKGNSGAEIISYNYRGPLHKKYDLWIGDEIHFVKNLESQRTQVVYGAEGIARRAARKWVLTATFAPNGRPVEMYPTLKALAPEFSQMTFNSYAQRYCGAHFDGRGVVYKGSSHAEELSAKLVDFLLRRTVNEVYPDRKRPLVSRVPLDLDTCDLNAVLEEENKIDARPRTLSPRMAEFSGMGDTSRLLHLLGRAKVRQVCNFVDDLLESEERVAVFYQHSAVGAALEAKYARLGVVRYAGGLHDREKDQVVRDFAAPNCRVFLGQQQACGTGINGLQRVCSTAVLCEPSWVPGETDQTIGRLDRIGQVGEVVRAYLLYARKTLDEVKVVVHDRKEKASAKLFPGAVKEWASWL